MPKITKKSDVIYYCKRCNRKFKIEECSTGGAPISGTFPISPCCESDIYDDDYFERIENNKQIEVWYSESELQQAIEKNRNLFICDRCANVILRELGIKQRHLPKDALIVIKKCP